jgi:hypothetical protein
LKEQEFEVFFRGEWIPEYVKMGLLQNDWVKMIHPSFSTLLPCSLMVSAHSIIELICDLLPLFVLEMEDKSLQSLVLSDSPGLFGEATDSFRQIPLVETLRLCSSRDEVCYFLPIMDFEISDGFTLCAGILSDCVLQHFHLLVGPILLMTWVS